MKTCKFDTLRIRSLRGVPSSVAGGGISELRTSPENLSPLKPYLNPGFKLSKPAKSLTAGAFLCSAVLSVALMSPSVALADIEITGPLTVDTGGQTLVDNDGNTYGEHVNGFITATFDDDVTISASSSNHTVEIGSTDAVELTGSSGSTLKIDNSYSSGGIALYVNEGSITIDGFGEIDIESTSQYAGDAKGYGIYNEQSDGTAAYNLTSGTISIAGTGTGTGATNETKEGAGIYNNQSGGTVTYKLDADSINITGTASEETGVGIEYGYGIFNGQSGGSAAYNLTSGTISITGSGDNYGVAIYNDQSGGTVEFNLTASGTGDSISLKGTEIGGSGSNVYGLYNEQIAGTAAFTLEAENGSISIDASSISNNSAFAAGIYNDQSLTDAEGTKTTFELTAQTITLKGEVSGSSAHAFGIYNTQYTTGNTYYNNTTTYEFTATGEGGSISLIGTRDAGVEATLSETAGIYNFQDAGTTIFNFTAEAGSITVKGENAEGQSISNWAGYGIEQFIYEGTAEYNFTAKDSISIEGSGDRYAYGIYGGLYDVGEVTYDLKTTGEKGSISITGTSHGDGDVEGFGIFNDQWGGTATYQLTASGASGSINVTGAGDLYSAGIYNYDYDGTATYIFSTGEGGSINVTGTGDTQGIGIYNDQFRSTTKSTYTFTASGTDGSINIEGTGGEVGAGIYTYSNAGETTFSLTAENGTISIKGAGDYAAYGIYEEQSYGTAKYSLKAKNISITANVSDTGYAAAGIDVNSLTTVELVGTDTTEGKMEITVNESSNPTDGFFTGVSIMDSSLTASSFASAEITVAGVGGIGLYVSTGYNLASSTIKFSDVGEISINAEIGALAYRVYNPEKASISLAATDKISITSSGSTDEFLAGTAVAAIFSNGSYSGSAGEDSRTAEVSIESGEVVANANQAFAAVVTRQEPQQYVSLQAENVKPLDADTGISTNSIINVTADTLTVNASDFVAAAYMDLSAYDNLLDWPSGEYRPDWDYGQTAQINLNVSDSGVINGTSTLTGNVFANHNSQVNIGLGSGSTWTGFSQDSRVDPVVHSYIEDDGQDTTLTYTDSIPGEVNVYAAGGATWNVRPIKETTFLENRSTNSYGEWLADLTVSGTKSYLTTWNSSGSSVINLNLTGATDVSYYGNEYQSVDIKYLKGSGTEFQVHTNIDGDRGSDLDLSGLTTDHAIIHSGEGAHYIYVAASGSGSTTEQAGFLVLHLEEEGASSTTLTPTWDDAHEYITGVTEGQSGSGSNPLSFTLADKDGNATVQVAQGLYYYSLATRDVEDPENYGGEEGQQATEWYLVRSKYVENTEPEPDPDPDPNPDPNPDSNPNPGDTGPGPASDPETNEGRTVAALAGIGNKLSMHYAQLSDLRKRLGEVRYGAQDGLWVRYIYQRNRYDGVSSNVEAKQNMHTLNLGLDHIISQDEDRMWMLGGDFKLGHDNEHIKSARGKGNLNSYGVDLYATYANQFGCYTDLVLSFDKYHQKIGSKLEDNSSANGRFNTWGWGASVEVGKMFSTTQNDENWGPWHNHWWVEPQAQLSYYWIKGKDFSMNNGMTVSQHNGDSLVGRLGVVVGKQWSYGGAKKADKRYVQAYLKGGVKHEFLGNQKTKINGVNFDHNLRGTTGYYGGGVDWNLTKQVKAYAQVERDAGGRYKKDIEASIGLKWQF